MEIATLFFSPIIMNQRTMESWKMCLVSKLSIFHLHDGGRVSFILKIPMTISKNEGFFLSISVAFFLGT